MESKYWERLPLEANVAMLLRRFWRFGGDLEVWRRLFHDERLLAEAARLDEVRHRSFDEWLPGDGQLQLAISPDRGVTVYLPCIYLDRPACEYDMYNWNAYRGTKVCPRTALCKADYNYPAGLNVKKALLRAQHRLCLTSDRHHAPRTPWSVPNEMKRRCE